MTERGSVQQMVCAEGQMPTMRYRTRDLRAPSPAEEWGWSKHCRDAYSFPSFATAAVHMEHLTQAGERHVYAVLQPGPRHSADLAKSRASVSPESSDNPSATPVADPASTSADRQFGAAPAPEPDARLRRERDNARRKASSYLTTGSVMLELLQKWVGGGECFCTSEGVAARGRCEFCLTVSLLHENSELFSDYLTELGNARKERDALQAELSKIRDLAALASSPASEPKPVDVLSQVVTWIPVATLPLAFRVVHLAYEDGTVHQGVWYGSRWHHFSVTEEEPTHWAEPLLSPSELSEGGGK